MGRFFQAIGRFISTYLWSWGEDIEDAIPLERRLAKDRQERSEVLKEMMGKATNIGELVQRLARMHAEAKIREQNLGYEVQEHLRLAMSAQQRNDSKTEEEAKLRAAVLADDLAVVRAEVTDYEDSLKEATQNKEDAYGMVMQYSDELRRMSHNDARIVARVQLAEMKEETSKLMEAMLDVIPEDRDNIRARAIEKSNQRMDRAKARQDLVTRMSESTKRGRLAQQRRVTAGGSAILREMSEKVGYTPTLALPAPVPEPTLEEIIGPQQEREKVKVPARRKDSDTK